MSEAKSIQQVQVKHIHFIGICGTFIGPLAVALKNRGFKVTGSDQAFYPPMSTFLIENKIKIIPGYKPDKFEEIGKPDIAHVMGFLSPENPEVKYMIENNVELIGLGQLFEHYFLKDKSVVVTGNFGKTTITSLVAWILETAGFDPTVFAGGYMNNFSGGVKIGQSDWLVSEGDEFKGWHISRDYQFERRPRVLYQKPSHLIFTDATWDHYDLYPTEAEYLGAFKQLVREMPDDGHVVGYESGKNVAEVLETSSSTTEMPHVDPGSISYDSDGATFELAGTTYKTPMLGRIGIDNSVLAISMALQIGIDPETIQKALDSYQGVKRRQEVRFSSDTVTILDDFAHSPIKLRGLIEALRLHYRDHKIIMSYQPGSKDPEAMSKYSPETFADIDDLILPKVSSVDAESRQFNEKLSAQLASTGMINVEYIDDDNKVATTIAEKVKVYESESHKVIVVFAAQKGFRGIIESTIESLDK